jgi:hypothetical protein
LFEENRFLYIFLEKYVFAGSSKTIFSAVECTLPFSKFSKTTTKNNTIKKENIYLHYGLTQNLHFRRELNVIGKVAK